MAERYTRKNTKPTAYAELGYVEDPLGWKVVEYGEEVAVNVGDLYRTEADLLAAIDGIAAEIGLEPGDDQANREHMLYND